MSYGTGPSKARDPLPENFGPVFFRNQFRTKLELPTRAKYPSARGLTAIVTGSNTGLGLEASKHLVNLGVSHLILAVRSLDAGERAADSLRALQPSAKLEVWQLDMESYDSIKAFVRRCEAELQHIDIVMLNAGLAAGQFVTNTATGHEKTIQVNYLGTMLLTVLLLPILKNKSRGPASPPHISITNSVTAHLCKFPTRAARPLLPSFDDTATMPFDGNERYAVSKLLGQFFLVKLTELVSADDVIINMPDPGLTKGTGLFKELPAIARIVFGWFLSIAGRAPDRAAVTYVDAVLGKGKESHGCWLMNCDVAPLSKWYYSEKDTAGEALWAETLEEFRAIGVDVMDILNRL